MKRIILMVLMTLLGGCREGNFSEKIFPVDKDEVVETVRTNWKNTAIWQSEMLKEEKLTDVKYASASGAVKLIKQDSGFLILTRLTNSPEFRGTDYYEVWLKEKEEGDWISLGKLEQTGADWVGATRIETNKKKLFATMVSIEQNDADPLPATLLMQGELLPTGL